MRRRCAAVVAGLVVASAAGPAARAGVVRPGDPPGLDLGIFGHTIPTVLKTAKADPYAAPAAPACETIPREIAALDQVLGPDADSPSERMRIKTRATNLLGQAIRGFIPHRDAIRFVTGADHKDKALRDAAMAGWARRGFLKGLEVNLGCAERPVTDEAAPAVETASVEVAATLAARPLPAQPTLPEAADGAGPSPSSTAASSGPDAALAR